MNTAICSKLIRLTRYVTPIVIVPTPYCSKKYLHELLKQTTERILEQVAGVNRDSLNLFRGQLPNTGDVHAPERPLRSEYDDKFDNKQQQQAGVVPADSSASKHVLDETNNRPKFFAWKQPQESSPERPVIGARCFYC